MRNARDIYVVARCDFQNSAREMWTAYVKISKLGTFTVKKNFTNKKNYARKRYFLSLLPTPPHYVSLLPTPLLPPKQSDVIKERPLTKNTL